MPDHHIPSEVDVLVLGGSLSGSSMGLLLRRANPKWSVAIVEKSQTFKRRVGESTSEVGGCYLTRVLRLSRYLSQEQVVKHGLRLWFQKEGNDCLFRCGEIGPFFQARLPTYQLDRSSLDEHVLELAEQEGCRVVRPARSTAIELGGIGANRVTIKTAEGEEQVIKSKWVVDATGKAAVIGRQRDTLEPLSEHATKSVWARFRGVRDLDGPELALANQEFAESCSVSRGAATNHLMGRGWWCWLIPLKGGELSAGLTYDPRFFRPERGANLTETLLAHLREHPVGRWMFEEAEPVSKDILAYTQLAYRNQEIAGPGWVCVGDAAGFMDPLYSHGIDFIAHTVMTAKRCIEHSLQGEDAEALAATAFYQSEYTACYERWFDALYRDKYAYLGDADLMRAAFLLDIGAYFIGPVHFVYRDTENEYARLPYHGPIGGLIARFMSLYNRRLVALANRRQAVGRYGERNLDFRTLVRPGFSPGPAAIRPFMKGLFAWWRCELQGLSHLFLPRVESVSSQMPPAPMERADSKSHATP